MMMAGGPDGALLQHERRRGDSALPGALSAPAVLPFSPNHNHNLLLPPTSSWRGLDDVFYCLTKQQPTTNNNFLLFYSSIVDRG
jgi:hypothetical protein